jgi:hypothetical protein
VTAAGFATAGQALAATLMDCQGTVAHPGPPSTPDPVTGLVTPTQTTVYAGPMRVKPYSRITGTGVTAGEAKDSMVLYTVSVPMTVTDARPGDIVHVTASTDSQLLTRTTFRVVAVERSSQITARRMTCELVEDRST